MDIEKTCAFTGHRAVGNALDISLLTECVKGFIEKGYDTFLCGMAIGFDLIAAQTVLSLKEQFDNVKLIACVPCPGQERFFPDGEKEKYSDILSKCDQVITVSAHYYKGCMHTRDRFIGANSSVLIAYERPATGGTHYTPTYARSLNKKILII